MVTRSWGFALDFGAKDDEGIADFLFELIGQGFDGFGIIEGKPAGNEIDALDLLGIFLELVFQTSCLGQPAVFPIPFSGFCFPPSGR